MRATLTHLVGPRKGERLSFASDRLTIGRADDNDLSFGDGQRRVSAHHAELTRVADQYVLKDRGSTNGTMINGRRIIVSEVGNNDLIEFGAGGPLLRFTIEKDPSEAPEEVEAIPTFAIDSGFRSRTTGRVGKNLEDKKAGANNRILIGAMLASMLVGAVGGILISRRSIDPSLMTPAEISARNRDSVVFIRTEFEMLDMTGQVTSDESCTGSGFIVSTDGLIVTNRHVVHDWEYNNQVGTGRVKRISVVLPGHEISDALEASIYALSASKESDVAILKIDTDPVSTVELDLNTSEVVPGSDVVVLGYPLGADLLDQTRDSVFEASLATGTVSRVGHDFIQLNMNAYRGDSGGPVFTNRGRVIGILTGRLKESNIAICTPITAATPLIK